MSDQLAHEALVILERDDALVFVTCNRLLELDALLDEALDPESERSGSDGKRRDSNLAAALTAATRVRPGKERQNCTRTAGLVAEIEVIGRRVVEVDGAFDEPEAENSGVEIEISLRVAGDTGDVMDTRSPESHRVVVRARCFGRR